MGYGMSPLTGKRAGLHIFRPSDIQKMDSEQLGCHLSQQVAHTQYNDVFSKEQREAWEDAVTKAAATDQRGVFTFHDQVYVHYHNLTPQQKFVYASEWLDDFETGRLTPEQKQWLES